MFDQLRDPTQVCFAILVRWSLNFGVLVLTVGCRGGRSAPAPPPSATPADVTPTTSTYQGVTIACPAVIRLVQHDKRAEDVDGSGGASACVELAQAGLPRTAAMIGCVPLGEPYFAEPVELESDRCTDDGSTAGDLRAVCIGHKGALVHVHAWRDGPVLRMSGDDQTSNWGPNDCIAIGSLRFEVPNVVPRFDDIRASWGQHEPSGGRCAEAGAPVRTVDVILRETMPPFVGGARNPPCGDTGARDAALVELLVPSLGIRRDLGILGNSCGEYDVYEYSDIGGVAVASSNMGNSERFAFALGNRVVYLTRENRTETFDLPCGCRPRLRVEANGPRYLLRSTPTFLSSD